MASFDGMNQGQARANKYGGPWSTQESSRLEFLVKKYTGPTSQVHWVEIAREHGTRDAKQCRERWDNHLKPGLRRDKITDQEGAFIMEWVSRQGKHWAPLGRSMQRPENMVKNYWYQEHKKLERGGRQKAHRVSSPTMSRSDSSSSQHATYGAPSVSPTYRSHSYHQGMSPTFTSPQYYQPASAHHGWSFSHSTSLPSQQYQPQPRRVSDASASEQTPSLASDHGSPVESPRTAPSVPYPLGQFTLPTYTPPNQKLDLLSPKEMLDLVHHRRSTSSSSYGSTGAIPISPTSDRLQSSASSYSHDSYPYRQGEVYDANSRNSSSARASSKSRISINSLLS